MEHLENRLDVTVSAVLPAALAAVTGREAVLYDKWVRHERVAGGPVGFWRFGSDTVLAGSHRS